MAVHRNEGQLVEPAGDAAFAVHIAHSLAGAHGDAQHIRLAQTHGAGQRGHIAVVDHFKGHVAERVGNGADIDILDLGIEQLLRNLQEQGCVHGAVVDIHAGGGHAHRVHPRQMRGGGLQRGHNAVVVIIGVGGHLGEPHDLLGIDALTVDDSGDLPVGAAGVKADAAPLQMPAHLLGGILGCGNLIHQNDLKGALKNVGHVVEVEILLAPGGVGALQIVVSLFVSGHVNFEAALHPQDGLDQSVNIIMVGRRHFRRTVNKGTAGCHLAVRPLHRNGHGLFGSRQKSPVEFQDGNERRVELGGVLDRDLNAMQLHLPASSFTICTICSHLVSISETSRNCVRLRIRLCAGRCTAK